jgi:bleomycin hydrolase
MKYCKFFFLFLQITACGQKNTGTNPNPVTFENAYSFTAVKEVPALPVINQHASGTCWAFSTTSFLESEIQKIKGSFIDLSEMYFVRNAYLFKTRNYVLRQGTARFSEGGCNHDPLIDLAGTGLLPQIVYSGHVNGDTIYDHRKMVKKLTPIVKDFANPDKKLGPAWKTAVPAILDEFIGKPAETFSYEGKSFTPAGFVDYTGLNADDYINITSFTHAPLNKPFVLEIPANWANKTYYNLSLEEYMGCIDHALDSGYSLTIDVDISEPGFSFSRGVAILPANTMVSAGSRQSDFENFTTTDDHNMHIVGTAKDQQGNLYYKCKNSWGPASGRNGYFYLSASYVMAKSISVMLNKQGLPAATRKRLGL